MKMNTSFYLLVLLFICLARADYSGPTFSSPLFMWSNSEYFVGKNLHVNKYTSTEEVVNSLVGQHSSLETFLKEGKVQPEVIFVFVEPELRTEQFPLLADSYSVHPNGGAFSKLKGTLESYATSSLVVTYTHSGTKSIGSELVYDLADNLAVGATITLVKDSDSDLLSEFASRKDVARISLAQLKFVASKDWSILSNGKTDLVIVCFDSPAVHADNIDQVLPSYVADDAFMHSILHSLGSSYLAVFTADKAATESVKHARATFMVRQLSDTTDDSIYPSDLIEAHIVLIPFLIILFTGICCTFGVQSDLKFDAEKKNYNKK